MAILRPPVVANRWAGPQRGVSLLTHTYLALALTVTPFAQSDWPVPKAAQPASTLRTHTDSFKLPLTTHTPKGRLLDWPNPRGPRPLVLDWVDDFKLPLTIAPQPFNQFDWPVVLVKRPGLQYSWSDSFKLSLTTVTAPYTEYNWPVPQAPRQNDYFASWSQTPQLTVTAPPFFQTDWPNPGRGAQQPALTWTDAFKLPLTTVTPPYINFDWPNPYPPRRAIDLANFTSSGCSILRGPVYPATITFDYPNPRGRQPPTVEWTYKFPIPLTTVRAPNLNFDWPVPARPMRVVDFGFVKPTDPKIQRPTGVPAFQTDWPVPQGRQPLTVEWSDKFKLPLTTTRAPFTQYDWPVTRAKPEPSTLRTWAGRFSLPLTAVKPVGRQLDWPNPSGPRAIQPRLSGQPFGLFTATVFDSHYEMAGTSQVTFYSAYIVEPDTNVPAEVTLLAVASTAVATEVSLHDAVVGECAFQDDAFQSDTFAVCDDEDQIVETANVNLIQDPNT